MIRLPIAPSRARGLVLLVASGMAAACGGDRTPGPGRTGGDSAATAAGAGGPAEAIAGGKPACVLEGDWSQCSVEDRLEHAGLVVEKLDEPARHFFFAVPGIAYQVGGKDDRVEVYLYPSTEARIRDTDALDSATVSPKGKRETWSAPPTLVTSNNLAAVILSMNDRTVERLALALGAGLPQPERR